MIKLMPLFLTLSTALAFDRADLPKKLEKEGFRDVIVSTGRFYISGQPDEAGLKWLKEQGVTTVINLRTPKEMNNRKAVPYDEAAVVVQLGMNYVHIPQGGDDHPYGPEALDRFVAAVDASKGKILLHCTVAWRASHLWAAYLVQQGVPLEVALKHAKAINFGNIPFEAFLGGRLEMKVKKTPSKKPIRF